MSERTRKLRILFISGTFYPRINGAVIAVANMMTALKDRGHEVWLLTRGVSASHSNYLWNGIRIIRVHPGLDDLPGRSSLALNQLRQGISLMKNRFDVIHANGFTALAVAMVLGKLYRIPAVATFHGFQRLWSKEARWRRDIAFTLTYPIERILLKSAEKVILQSRALRDILLLTYRLKTVNAEIIPHPLDISRFRPSERNIEINPNVLFVGSLSRVHGADLVVEAACQVVKDIPGARFTIVGGGPRGTYLIELINKLNLSRTVSLTGRITNPDALSRIYARSSVVVVPLRYKGYILSLVALEAMASGTPVVTTMTLDPELANYGVYVAAPNPGRIAEQITRILQMSNQEYLSISKSARKYVEEFSAQEVVASKVESIYYRLAKAIRKK